MEDSSQSVTAYGGTAAELRERLQEAAVDHDSFERQISLCDLASCRATCCHDGVFLSEEEAEMMREMMAEHGDRFSGYGVEVSSSAVVSDEHGVHRTATRPSEGEERASDFPAHFLKTRCVFLDDQHRCTWQRLAGDLGKPAWFFKPIGCWLHPLTLRPVNRVGGRPVLRLPGVEDDPLAGEGYPGFASCTPCGRVCDAGRPASEVLRPELEALSEIGGRDFVGEVEAEAV